MQSMAVSTVLPDRAAIRRLKHNDFVASRARYYGSDADLAALYRSYIEGSWHVRRLD